MYYIRSEIPFIENTYHTCIYIKIHLFIHMSKNILNGNKQYINKIDISMWLKEIISEKSVLSCPLSQMNSSWYLERMEIQTSPLD